MQRHITFLTKLLRNKRFVLLLGATTAQYFRHFSVDREDAANPTSTVPPLTLDVNRNVVSLAKRRHLPEDDVYDGIRNPYVLIINNVNFWSVPEPRTGAQHDLDNVMSFVKRAGFKTVVQCPDLRKSKLLDLLEETRQSEVLGKENKNCNLYFPGLSNRFKTVLNFLTLLLFVTGSCKENRLAIFVRCKIRIGDTRIIFSVVWFCFFGGGEVVVGKFQ